MGVKGDPRKAGNLTVICELSVWKMWEPRRLTILWASKASDRDSFTSFFNQLTRLRIKLNERGVHGACEKGRAGGRAWPVSW
jgi:hypothetical protein